MKTGLARRLLKKQRNKMIIEKHKKGFSNEEIMKEFNVDKSTVEQIINSFKEKGSEA